MKVVSRTVYECEFCGKISKSKSGIKIHEKYCRKNPENKTYCYECKYCESVKKEYTAYHRMYGGVERVVNNAPFCNYYDAYLIAPLLAKKSWFDLSDDEILMPVSANKVCEHFKEKTTWEI